MSVSTLDFPGSATVASPWLRLGKYLIEVLLMFATLYIGWIIWALTLSGTGQTPAAKLMGLRVIRADTRRPAGLGYMFWMRGVVAGFAASIAIPLTVGILLFMPFWDKNNQNLWDKVSRCYVVNDPDDAWGVVASKAIERGEAA